MIAPLMRVHLVGIGGAGMSALAEVLLHRGVRVSGCDLRDCEALRRIRALGGEIRIGHSPDHLAAADAVVYSRAITEDNPEIRAAHGLGLPVLHRAEMLAQVMASGRGVAVVGTHGKTTTTAMLVRVLAHAGLDPTGLIGADVEEYGGGARPGDGAWIVAEVDESDGSLLHVRPDAAVLTSLDSTDHRDHYAAPGHLEETFERFLGAVPGEGFIAVCLDHAGAIALGRRLRRPLATYGFDAAALVRGQVRVVRGEETRTDLWIADEPSGELVLRVPGRHNVSNALGAIAAAAQIGVPIGAVLEALEGFRGPARRFAIRGEADGVLVVDDYAHNPVKIDAVLRAAREGWPDRRVIALFQPHRYSRTRTTHAEFACAFDAADEVVLTEIYPADEPAEPGVTARLVVDAVARRRPVRFAASREEALNLLEQIAAPGAIVLTLGAGDIGDAADALLRRLEARSR